ncbi:MAG: hypothetical protein LEGION0403_FIIPPAGN_01708 [Legionella sp.]
MALLTKYNAPNNLDHQNFKILEIIASNLEVTMAKHKKWSSLKNNLTRPVKLGLTIYVQVKLFIQKKAVIVLRQHVVLIVQRLLGDQTV